MRRTGLVGDHFSTGLFIEQQVFQRRGEVCVRVWLRARESTEQLALHWGRVKHRLSIVEGIKVKHVLVDVIGKRRVLFEHTPV